MSAKTQARDVEKEMLHRITTAHQKFLAGYVAEAEEILCKTFGWKELRPAQHEAILENSVYDKNLFLMWPPGRGKSVVAYTRVLLHRGVHVIVVPTNMIGETHAIALRKLGVEVITTTGGGNALKKAVAKMVCNNMIITSMD